MADVRERLSSVPLFQGLSGRELKQLAAAAKEVEFSPGTAIVEEGRPAMDFYLILRGEAKVKIEGRTRARLGPGDHFGEISVLDGGPRTATVVAETAMWALRLERDALLPLLDRHGQIARKILTELAARYRAAAGTPRTS